MFRSLKLLKRYYNLANLKKSYLFFEFVLLLIPALLSIISPLIAANIISSLTVFDFSKAVYLLWVDFIIIVSSAIFYFAYHLLSRKINKILYNSFNEFLYDNIKKNKNIKTINLPTLTNVSVCIEFNKNFLYKLCFFIKSIITLAIIFYYNYVFCFIIILVSFVTYFLLRITDKKIQLKNKALSDLQNESLELFNSIHKGGDIEENYNLNVVLKNKYFNLVDKQTKTSNSISLLYSINKNFISLILKIAIFIMTVFLVGQIKSTMLTLSLYLIVTPYLTSSAQNLISFFELFTEFGKIENILNEFDALKFSEEQKIEQKTKLSGFDFYLYQLSFENKEISLKNINLEVKFGEAVLIKSPQKEFSAALISLLKRQQQPSAGSIFIENKNVSDLKIEDYRKIINFTSVKPFFYNVSLIENLLMMKPTKKTILKAASDLKLKQIIDGLPEKENTIISETINDELLFLFGLLRCFVSGAKIICVESVPPFADETYKSIFFHIIKFLKNKRSVMIFSQNSNLEIKTAKSYLLEKNSLKQIE